MDVVLLSRIKFAMTAGFHFIFPPITIGLAWMLVWMFARYRKTGDELYGRMARFWLKIFGVTFAVGVATGITLEFQFGTNWADYSRFVGDIFGAPLAAEGIFAFFLESTFVGVLLFGWKRLSKKAMWFASLMVAIGATLSAFWIIVANSWMQTPAGYEIVNGRAQLVDFFAAVFNPSTVPRYLHTVNAALITGAMFVMGISAWFMLKGRDLEFAKKSLRASLWVALLSSMAQMPLGHYHAVQVAQTQPEKLAAFEGLYETQRNAPALLFGIPDDENETVNYAIEIPGALSLLAFGDANAEVKGLKDFPRDERPPMAVTFYSFHMMVMLGGWFVLLPLVGLFLTRKGRTVKSRLFLRAALLSIPLPVIANELGWIAAEVGRQPWIVYRVLKTADASSAAVVTSGEVLVDMLLLTVIYIGIFGAWVYAIKRIMNKGPVPLTEMEVQS
ncbi:MAG: cytochrome ubiquinol oxidase subunit I [Phycisphaerae bacterium]|jgi:cytochrome d ubiquinol oxidase subunit I|nr:cytochrome ubiquinol oxidase subunit I [Phycisphaerae bacterium]